jgi:hypothetical protein
MGAAGTIIAVLALGFTIASNWRSERIARAGTRAYLNVEDTEIFVSGEVSPITVAVTLLNSGVTPAKGVRGYWGYEVSDEPTSFDRSSEERSQVDVGPSTRQILKFETAECVSYLRFLATKKTIWAQGALSYEDVYGERRETRFRYRMVFDSSGSVRLATTTDGNNST